MKVNRIVHAIMTVECEQNISRDRIYLDYEGSSSRQFSTHHVYMYVKYKSKDI